MKPSSSEGTYFDHEHVTVLEPRRAFQWLDLREIWAYRELLGVLMQRDIRVRYRQAALGVGWALLRPLLGVVVFTLVFGRFAKMPSDGVPYPVFVLAGTLPWTFFSSAVAAATESVVGAQQLVTKVFFPRVLVPISTLGAPSVDLLVSLPLLAIVSMAYGYRPRLSWLLVPLPIVLLIFATLGAATWLAALNVTYRDVRHLVPFALQIGLYATPVVFPPTLFPARYRPFLYLNPAAGAVEAFRAASLGRPCDGAGVSLSLFSAALILFTGLAYFSSVERRIADIV
jgi:lipopolysaccharide transport system permease protein